MAEVRINETGKLTLFDADDSHSASIAAGTITANETLMTLNTADITFSVPKIVIGDATAEDTSIVFDGNAQDFYIGLDDSADDLIIGLGSAVGTTPIISVDENKDVSIPDGGLTITTSDNTDQLTLTSTDTDANAGARLRIFRNSSSPADSDFTGDIRFESKNDAAQDFVAAQMLTASVDVSDGTEDAQLIFKTMTGGTLTEYMRFDPGSAGIVFNDGGADIDFRVESQVGTHAFFVNGASGNGCAGFYSASDSAQLFIENQNAAGGRIGVFIQHPSSSDTGTGLNVRSTRSSGLSSSSHILTASNNGSDAEFNFRGDGNAFCDGSFSGGGADYAEYFEWKDGNSSDEDRVGYSVVLDGNKIVKATDSDEASKIIGVISATPAMVGDSDILRWKQKFLLDDFGREITEEITVTEWRGEHTTDEGIFNKNYLYSYDTDRIPSDITVPSDAEVKSVDDNGNKFLRRKTNPDWNESETYISREDRKEWDTVGLMGKLRLRKGQPTGTNWIKMRDISDTVEEWLVR